MPLEASERGLTEPQRASTGKRGRTGGDPVLHPLNLVLIIHYIKKIPETGGERREDENGSDGRVAAIGDQL
jgi:hypothetical protein